jgi:hypothetical protein
MKRFEPMTTSPSLTSIDTFEKKKTPVQNIVTNALKYSGVSWDNFPKGALFFMNNRILIEQLRREGLKNTACVSLSLAVFFLIFN